jgi:RNA polymerase sigma-70 factor (ECF subfamily)
MADNGVHGALGNAPATPAGGLSTSVSLLAGLRAQDREAWRGFVALYAPLVVRWCHRQGLGEADVADVTQEVFRCVFQSLPLFRKAAPADSFRGWLCRIAHRQIAEFFRRRAPVLRAEGGSGQLSWLQRQPEPAIAEPDSEEARQEERFLFQQAVQTVRGEFSDKHWHIFWRVAVDGQPAAAVAGEFGTTAAAVRQAKARVLRRLKEVVGILPDESGQS